MPTRRPGPISRRRLLQAFGVAGAASALRATNAAAWQGLGPSPQHRVSRLAVGPIAGYTSHQAVRLWGAGAAPFGDGDVRHGIVQLSSEGRLLEARYFPLPAAADCTGSVDL